MTPFGQPPLEKKKHLFLAKFRQTGRPHRDSVNFALVELETLVPRIPDMNEAAKQFHEDFKHWGDIERVQLIPLQEPPKEEWTVFKLVPASVERIDQEVKS